VIAFLPHCAFLSEVSRALEIARALQAQGMTVAFASRGGPYAHLITGAGFHLHQLEPVADDDTAGRFLDALLKMGPRMSVDFFTDEELRTSVQAEFAFLREVGAHAAVTGFTLSAYLSTRLAGIPLITDHGGSFVPPVLARKLCPPSVNPPDPNLAKLPVGAQHWLANRVPAFIKSPVAQLNRHAAELGLQKMPGVMSLMCGDLTLVTELPEMLGMSNADLERWRPKWPFRGSSQCSFRFTGPLYARLEVPVPPHVDSFLGSDGPVVYLTPTSVHESFLRSMVERTKACGARVLVGATIHNIADLADERAMITGVLPNHLIMDRVDAAVMMGGQGSVQTAIAAGTPFVGLAYHGEQELNIAVAERLGMAIRMAPHGAETDQLTRAIDRILHEPSFAQSATRAARQYEGIDGAAMAADAILAWLSERTPRAAA
jgi:UDP:flavonoid glycosyltransferase YjiC (YdhE family)